jgi:tetratricopeptide (TPR) repeat protein
MNESYKLSYRILLAIIFLLPLFFLPENFLPLSVAKSALLAFGAIAVLVAFLYETLDEGKLSLPSSALLWGALLIPLVYLASSLLGGAAGASLFGYNIEVGTFGSMLFVSILFGVSALAFRDVSRVMNAYAAILISISIVLAFGLVKLFSGGALLTLGAFAGVMGNPVGAWTDYAVVFGLASVISLFALEVLVLNKGVRAFLYALLVLSVFMLAAINFSSAWQLVFGTSLISLVYFLTIEKRIQGKENSSSHSHQHADKTDKAKFAAPILVLAVSFLFMLNPMVSATKGTIGNAISSSFGVSNADVRPSFSSTFAVSKEVLKSSPVFGSGPNTFGKDWLIHKPAGINDTSFWSTAFPYGMGFLSTEVSTVGLLGTLVYIAFLALFIMLGFKALSKNSENEIERFVAVSSFMGALFLWASMLVYVPSTAVIALAFILTGIFVGSANATGIIASRSIAFSKYLSLNFIAVLVLITCGIGAAGLGFVAFQKVLSVVHFERAIVLANTEGSSIEEIEAELGNASSLSPQDVYFTALSQLEFARAQAALSSTTGTPEENRQIFETALSKSISGAQMATQLNPDSYQNWITLGSLYAALVPKPLDVAEAYDSAKSAYAEALKRNPLSPEVPLLLAKLELDKGNTELARVHIKEALAKKTDYADAYFLLTQLEANENNLSEAIKSAETASLLSPTNAGVFFQLGLLKYMNKDYAGAVQSLTSALSILPDYANAKYYLGLSYEALGRHDEAVAIFESLALANPENEGVKQILSNLHEGKDPFSGDAASLNPSNSTNPPIDTEAKNEE